MIKKLITLIIKSFILFFVKSIRVDLDIHFSILNILNDKNLSNFKKSLTKYLFSIIFNVINYVY